MTPNFRPSLRILFILFFQVLVPLALQGSDVYWINSSGGNWSNGANWSSGTVPGAGNTVVINAAGSYTVNLNANVAIANLTLHAGAGNRPPLNTSAYTITISGGNVTVAQDATLALGGVLTGGNLNLLSGGNLNWSAGTLGANTTIYIGAKVYISGTGTKVSNNLLTCGGNITHMGTGSLRMDSGSSLFIASGGLYDIQDTGDLAYNNGGNVIVQGTLRKSLNSGTSYVGQPLDNLGGTVEVKSGTLQVSRGGRDHEGSWNASAGTT
ncbi:MAG: hypothetical protein HQL31_13455, partial [Planctomycetes bacterium]|nr:hypothetical protein [Planctomycetota bacterium]